MADTTIANLTDGVTAAATDRLPAERSPFGAGTNRYITPGYIATYLGFSGGVLAAANGGAGIVGYVSGNYYNNLFRGYGAGGNATARNISTGTIYYTPFFVERAATFTLIGAAVGTSSVNLNLALYNDSGAMKPTGAPISGTTSGSIACTINLFVSYTFASPVTLSAGVYWIGATSSATLSLPGPTGGGWEVGISRYLGRSTTPDTSPIDAELQAGWSEAFTYNTTMPTVGGSLSAFACLAAGDAYIYLRAQ